MWLFLHDVCLNLKPDAHIYIQEECVSAHASCRGYERHGDKQVSVPFS